MARLRPRLPRLRRLLRIAAWLLGLGLVAFNLLAWCHARSMLVFVPAGQRTASPEQLSWRGKAGLLLTGVRLPKPVLYRTPAADGLAYTTLVLRATGQPALELWRIPHPQPRGTVALLHGYSDCKSTLTPAAAAFHRLGYEVWLMDFPGSGGSDGYSTSIGYHEAESVQRLEAALTATPVPRPLVLFGFSMGGAAALRAVSTGAAHPDGLIVSSVFDRLLSTIRCRFDALGWPSFPAAETLLFWGGVQQRMNGFAHNPVTYAEQVTVPTLVLHGSADARAPVAGGSNLYARLAGPKQLVVFPGAGHESLYQFDPVRWEREVGAWLQTLPRPDASPR